VHVPRYAAYSIPIIFKTEITVAVFNSSEEDNLRNYSPAAQAKKIAKQPYGQQLIAPEPDTAMIPR
jgi:hypothetical protein